MTHPDAIDTVLAQSKEIVRLRGENSRLEDALRESRLEHLTTREIIINKIAEGERLSSWLGDTCAAVRKIEAVLVKEAL